MNYRNGNAFRHTLEDRLRDRSFASGEPLASLHKSEAFDRFLARLLGSSPETRALKGGFAFQLPDGRPTPTTLVDCS